MVLNLENYVINPYLRALVILIVFTLFFGVIAFLFDRVLKRVSGKTKSKLDDQFISKSSKPLTVLIFFIGLRIAINELPFSEHVIKNTANVIYTLIVVSLAFVIFYFVDIVLWFVLKETLKGSNSKALKSLTDIIHGVLKMVLVSLTILYILEVWGIEIGPFLATLGIAGLAVALALQPALANIFSGMSLILDKSIKVDDLIYLDSETKGKVLHVGLRSTKILTFDNELIIVPNSKIADSKIQNIGEPEPMTRVVIQFSVAYGSDVDKVKKIVMAEVKKVEHFIEEPEPLVRFLEMSDSALKFKAYFYVDSFENKWKAIDEANTKIYNALNKNKIGIPFPQMDVHIRK